MAVRRHPITFLISFRNLPIVAAQRLWSYVTFRCDARLITGVRQE
jgi:hypothetical protein